MLDLNNPYFKIRETNNLNKEFPYFIGQGDEVTDNGFVVANPDHFEFNVERRAWLDQLMLYTKQRNDQVGLYADDIYNETPVNEWSYSHHLAHCIEHWLINHDSLTSKINRQLTRNVARTTQFGNGGEAVIAFMPDNFDWHIIQKVARELIPQIIDPIKLRLVVTPVFPRVIRGTRKPFILT